MSLIVARCTSSSILFVADTKISITDGTANPYLQGISKVFFIDKYRVIAFAGDVAVAYSLIKKIDPDFSNEKIIQNLVSQQHELGEPVQFLFGRLKPRPVLVSIKNGSVKEHDGVGWIGDSDGYSLFQEYFHTPGWKANQIVNVEISVNTLPQGRYSADANTFSKMFNTMKEVIESERCATVGGFITAGYVENGNLEFASYLSLYRRPLELIEIGKNGVVPFGDACSGTFSVNFVGLGQSGFAVHIAQGRLGVIFKRGETLILEPTVNSKQSEKDFDYYLHQTYGCGLNIHIEKT